MKKRNLIAVLLALCLLSGLIPAYAVEVPVEEQTKAVCQDGACWKEPEVTIEIEEEDQGVALQSEVQSDPDGARKAIKEGILNVEETVDISSYGLSQEEALTVWNDVYYSTPEAFAVTPHIGMTINSAGVHEFIPTYNMGKEDYEAAKAYYEKTLDSIVSQVDESWSTLEKILFVHDYLAANYEYDTGYKIYDAYQFFLYNRGVCQAYELAFMAVMQKLDIPVSYVQSTALGHIWNLVQLDGAWYHLDVTWDSPLSNTLGYASHEDFLKSDDVFQTSHIATGEDGTQIYDWVYGRNDVQCNDKTYDNYFWNAAVTPFRYVNGTWYFIESETESKTVNGETVTYYSGSSLMAWDGGDGTKNRVLNDAFTSFPTGLEYFDGKLYFYGYYDGVDSICSYDLETGILKRLIQYDSDSDRYGLAIKDSADGLGKVLIYQICKEYYTDNKLCADNQYPAYYLEAHSGGENSGYRYLSTDENTLWLGLDGTSSVIAAAMDSQGKLISTEMYSESGTYDFALPEGTATIQLFALEDLASFVPVCSKVQVTVGS